jgi:hypothetical protein
MFHEERSVFWEVIISVILSKKMYMYMYPIPNGFRDRVTDVIALIKESQDALRRATRVAKCIDVDGGILENILY